jgi:hypothetical protein
MEITDEHVLVPLVIDVGSFLVPVTTVAFALPRRREGFLTIEQIALASSPSARWRWSRRRRSRSTCCRPRPAHSSA